LPGVNDDDKKLIGILGKIAEGDPKTEMNVRSIIRKNEHFKSMDAMHSLDFEKLCEVR